MEGGICRVRLSPFYFRFSTVLRLRRISLDILNFFDMLFLSGSKKVEVFLGGRENETLHKFILITLYKSRL